MVGRRCERGSRCEGQRERENRCREKKGTGDEGRETGRDQWLFLK